MSRNDTIGAITCALPGMNPDYLGLMRDVANRFNRPEPEAAAWHVLIADAVKQGLPKPTSAKPKPILRLISGGRDLIIPATTGQRTIAQAKNIFTAGVDDDFTNWGLDVSSVPTGPTKISVHEMVSDGNFKVIFRDFPQRFSQDQVIGCVERYLSWFREDGYATFLPFTVNGEDFVALVYRLFDGPHVFVYRFSHGHVWGAGRRPRVVVPQLDASST